MRKINAKQLLTIAVCGLALASCGGGGGGGAPGTGNSGNGGSGSGTTQPGGSGSGNGGTTTPPPPANPISMNIYAGTDYPNEPIVVVYINGQPVKMLLDTGASGVLVNQGAVSIPQSAYTSQTFSVTYGDGSTASGTVATATVCPTSSTVGCVTMPIAVNSQTSGSNVAFSSTGEDQGDFGMDCGYNTQGGPNAFCYLYYLWQQNPSYSSYSLSFNIPSNTFYYTPSGTTPIGTITYGSFSASNLISYPPYVLSANAVYGNSLTVPTGFDTGSAAVFLSRTILQAEIPNFSTSSDENNCGLSSGLQGGFNLYYQIPYVNSNSTFSTTFTTEPPSNMCSVFSNNPLILEGWTIDLGTIDYNEGTTFGLPEMIRHSYIWILGNNGMVQYVGVE
ncbi:MAG: retropepsin-like aspartic protease [Candidatus Nanopusillus acidilobi]